MHFPNLHFSCTSVDFGCTLNDTESCKQISMRNCSRLPVLYSWAFWEDATRYSYAEKCPHTLLSVNIYTCVYSTPHTWYAVTDGKWCTAAYCVNTYSMSIEETKCVQLWILPYMYAHPEVTHGHTHTYIYTNLYTHYGDNVASVWWFNIELVQPSFHVYSALHCSLSWPISCCLPVKIHLNYRTLSLLEGKLISLWGN